LAVGAVFVNPMTAQLMSIPEAPYGAGWPVAGLTPVSRSGRVAAKLNTWFLVDLARVEAFLLSRPTP
jgi:hypothetical protein